MNSEGRRRTRKLLCGAMILASTGGCALFNHDDVQPLTAEAFVAHRVEGRANPEPIDQPGQVIVDGVKPPTEEDAATPPVARDTRNTNEISPAVRRSLQSRAQTRPATKARSASPATRPASVVAAQRKRPTTRPDPGGQFVIFGTVLARVNEQPIYAHKLLAQLDKPLRTEARQHDLRGFRLIAADLIEKELARQVREELVYSIAEKSLDVREKEFSRALAAQWKKEEITKAGGSEELAKRRWAEEGWEFNDRLDYEYRRSVVRVYYQRRVLPLVHVRAGEIRQYYEAHKDTEFTDPARAKFRVIRIDPRQLKLPGGSAEARRLAAQVRDRATEGNFAKLARETNDPTLRATGGLVPGSDEGWLPKGTYVAEKVEDAVWSLEPGQVTDVIEEKGAYYVARLEDRQDALAHEFEDLEVQKRIDETLRAQQLEKLQKQRQDAMLKQSVVWENPQRTQPALDMAMQRYSQWASAEE
jgi:parvulin-like peptidyl-prolyl isomerase